MLSPLLIINPWDMTRNFISRLAQNALKEGKIGQSSSSPTPCDPTNDRAGSEPIKMHLVLFLLSGRYIYVLLTAVVVRRRDRTNKFRNVGQCSPTSAPHFDQERRVGGEPCQRVERREESEWWR